jgi:hypothetical protein
MIEHCSAVAKNEKYYKIMCIFGRYSSGYTHQPYAGLVYLTGSKGIMQNIVRVVNKYDIYDRVNNSYLFILKHKYFFFILQIKLVEIVITFDKFI